jgi:cytochrome c553
MFTARIPIPLWALILLAGNNMVQAADPKPAQIPNTIEQRVLACSACHGKLGEGIKKNEYYPRIGGKPAGYLHNQLLNFREGRRHYPQMTYLVE